MRGFTVVLVLGLSAGLVSLSACGDDDDDDGEVSTEAYFAALQAGLVEVEASEFQFDFDESAITPNSTGFRLVNAGAEEHELFVQGVSDDFDLEAALAQAAEDPEAEPEGLEEEVGGTFAPAGEEGLFAFGEPLAAGRYVMLCFVENEQGPHALQGMAVVFEVN